MISGIKFDAGYQQGVAGHLERPGRESDKTIMEASCQRVFKMFQIRIGSIHTKGFLVFRVCL